MDQRGTLRTAASYALAYVLWAVSVAASGVVGLLVQSALVQMVTVTVLSAASDQRTALYANLGIRAGDAWSYMLIGLILVGVLVFLEYWYRTGVPSGRLLPRFLLVTTIEVGALLLAHGAYFVVAKLAGVMPWRGVYIPAFELVAVALCVYLYRLQVRQTAKR